MAHSVFLVEGSRRLVKMRDELFESEAVLQRLLEQFPALLTGNLGSGEAAVEWVLVRREFAVPDEVEGPGRWSLDHMFLDAAGVPTLVEVKRSTDSRSRREVVAQMLD